MTSPSSADRPSRYSLTSDPPGTPAVVPSDARSARTERGCPFCSYEGPSPILAEYEGVYIIEPLNPVCDGHVLVIPVHHARDFAEDAMLTCKVASAAATYAQEEQLGDCNLITSKGATATQTVPHLHFHLVPRREGDGLALPRQPASPQLGQQAERSHDWILAWGCSGCGRFAATSRELLALGCEGRHEPLVPASELDQTHHHLAQAIHLVLRLRERSLEAPQAKPQP